MTGNEWKSQLSSCDSNDWKDLGQADENNIPRSLVAPDKQGSVAILAQAVWGLLLAWPATHPVRAQI